MWRASNYGKENCDSPFHGLSQEEPRNSRNAVRMASALEQIRHEQLPTAREKPSNWTDQYEVWVFNDEEGLDTYLHCLYVV